MAMITLANPDKVAYYEKAGWEAYYARQWGRAFWLLVRLNREMFVMGWWDAAAAAFAIVQASRAFAPVDNDIPLATRYLEQFYTRARRTLNLTTSPRSLAELEMDYWLVHRQLAVRRIQDPADQDIEPMIQSLARLHAALFNANLEIIRPSAEYRAMAAKMVDRITGNYTQDAAADWQAVERYLQKAYRSLTAQN